MECWDNNYAGMNSSEIGMDRRNGRQADEPNRKMRVKSLTRAMFVIWIGTITVLAVVPHANDGI